MEDKRIDEINKMKELEDKLKLLEEDLELTEKALEDANIDYCRRRELNDDVLYDRREIIYKGDRNYGAFVKII